MGLDYSDSLGGAIGLSGSPKTYENDAISLLKMDAEAQKKPKQKVEDWSKWTKIDSDVADWIRPEIQAKTNEYLTHFSDWQKNKGNATQLPVELQREHDNLVSFSNSKKLESKHYYDTLNKVSALQAQPGWQEKYDVDFDTLNTLADPQGLSGDKHNAIARQKLGGKYFNEFNVIKGKEKPFDVAADLNKNVLPQIKSALVAQGYATQNDDGSITTSTTKKITPDVIENIGKNVLSNDTRLAGVTSAHRIYTQNNPGSELKFNNPQDWYVKQQLAPFIKNEVVSKLSKPTTQSLRGIGSGMYTNNDFNYAFIKNGKIPDTQKASEILSVATGGLYEPNEFENKFASLAGFEGNKLVFTRNDKATENKQLTFKDETGNLVEGVPLGIAERKGAPYVVLSIPSQKLISKSVSDGNGGQVMVNVPATYTETLVPFKGANQGKLLTEYRGADEAIKKENPQWLQANQTVSTPAPKTKTNSSTNTIDEKVTVEKDGKKYKLPKAQLNQATKQGYKLVE